VDGSVVKITHIGHASILVQTRGIAILSDPWWRGPCFGAQWWNYPFPSLDSLAGVTIDYIYISHGHHDHFHPGTLNTLSKSAKVIVSAKTGLAASVRKLGFETLEADNDQTVELAGGQIKCRVMETHADDTMCVDDGSEVCVNLNDALHSAPRSVQRKFVRRLRALYQLDYVFCGYGVASALPQLLHNARQG
jgi:L-ascorbate metabolism protein UlaG (beta-lactamase superfamily)